MIYQDQENRHVTEKEVKSWRWISIGFWTLLSSFWPIAFFVTSGQLLVMSVIMGVMIYLILVLQIIGSLKALYLANLSIFFLISTWILSSYMLAYEISGRTPAFVVGFGITAIYTLKLKSFLHDKVRDLE